MKRKAILLAVIMILCVSSSVRAGGMANVPLDHWSYNAIDKLVAQGIIKNGFIYTRPYTRYQMAKLIAQALANRENGKIALSSYNNKLLDDLSSEFSKELSSLGVKVPEKKERKPFINLFSEEGGVKTYGYLKSEFLDKEELPITLGFSTFVDKGDDLSIFGRFHIDYQKKYEQFTRNYIWYLDNVYSQIKLPWFDLEVGRDKMRWGPGYYGTLLLSDNAPSFDMIKFSTTIGPVKAVSFTGVLNKSKNRYLSGHRIETDFLPGINLGFSETTVYSGRGIEPLYFNPLVPLYLCQYILGIDDNPLMDFDISIHKWKDIILYGELLVDDYQILPSLEPNELGYLGGAFFCSPSGKSDLRIEYTRINNYVYSVLKEKNNYIHQGKIIGHWLGPDAEDLFFELNHWISDKIQLTLQYEIENHGEGKIGHPWKPEKGRKNAFLSGVVEKKNIIGINASYEPNAQWELALGIKFWNIQNKEHIEGISLKDKEVKAEVKWKF